MNNCLADLSRLIPSSYLKKGRGRIEKTEIIEMAIKHIRHLQSHPCTKVEGCELESEIKTGLNKVRQNNYKCYKQNITFLMSRRAQWRASGWAITSV